MKLVVALNIPVDSSASPGVYGVTVKSQLCFNKKNLIKMKRVFKIIKIKKMKRKVTKRMGPPFIKGEKRVCGKRIVQF